MKNKSIYEAYADKYITNLMGPIIKNNSFHDTIDQQTSKMIWPDIILQLINCDKTIFLGEINASSLLEENGDHESETSSLPLSLSPGLYISCCDMLINTRVQLQSAGCCLVVVTSQTRLHGLQYLQSLGTTVEYSIAIHSGITLSV